jgi:hypothetical protein
MITELPNALREHVFDMLPTGERVKLNLALPKSLKITKTTKTDLVKTKKLGVFMKALKHRPAAEISEKTKLWIQTEFSDDPAADTLFDKYNIKRASVMSSHKTELLQRLANATREDLNSLNCCELYYELALLTPTKFDETITCAESFWKLLIEVKPLYLFTISVILSENEELLVHLLKLAQLESPINGFLAGDIDQCAKHYCETFICKPKSLDIFLKYLHPRIQQSDLENLIGNAIRYGHIDSLDVLSRHGLI